MDYLKLIVQIIEHMAWPVVALTIALGFKKEISLLLGRVKKAKYKDVEFDLQGDFQEVKIEAQNAGVTMAYSPSSFQIENIENLNNAPEWVFIKTWQDIENLLIEAYKKRIGPFAITPPISSIISALNDASVINEKMTSLIKKMQNIRNKIVHSSDSEITRGELLEWLGLSRSISERLKQQINNKI